MFVRKKQQFYKTLDLCKKNTLYAQCTERCAHDYCITGYILSKCNMQGELLSSTTQRQLKIFVSYCRRALRIIYSSSVHCEEQKTSMSKIY